jgi:hypothetical protein
MKRGENVSKQFNGVIKLDVRDSKADWGPYEQPKAPKFVSPELKPGKYTFGVEFTKESTGTYHESLGKARLYVNDQVIAEGPMRTQAGKFTLSGDGLCIGRDGGDNVSQECKTPGKYTGGMIRSVKVNVGKDQYLNLEKAAAAAFALE